MIDGDHRESARESAQGLAYEPAAAEQTVTGAVLGAIVEQAVRDPERTALVDTADAGELRYAGLAALVPAAASGLIQRGIRPGDVGAVHLDGARDLALAVHAITAAGAVPLLLPPQAAPAELAGLLTESAARFLLTSGALAPDALAATERSYVRQVFAFGDVPGATPFADLSRFAGGGDWPEPDPLRDQALLTPEDRLTHADRLADLYRLSAVVEVGAEDVLVACAHDFRAAPATWLGLIDLALTQGATFVACEPGGPALLAAVERCAATIAVTTPAALRELTFDQPASSAAELRLLVTGRPPAEVARACRRRHGWTVTPFA